MIPREDISKMDYKSLCIAACGIAREAGEYIARQRETFTFADVEFKGTQNMVSYVEKQAERMIVSYLQELTPDAGFITEEGTVEAAQKADLQWVIDPLDGTTNFIHGLAPFCVSIGLLDRGELVVGVVYEINMREMFYAWKGSDAFLNGRKISVSSTAKLENSLIAVGFAYSALANEDGFLDKMAWFQQNTNGIRRLGSAAADLVYTACGRFDAFMQVKLSPWDVAGGALIAKQAGAVVTDYSGGDNFLFGREIIAANPNIYEEFKQHV